ncbi:CDP-alcohol phosphatidyltransferase [Dulcicalothrix desertica PCC 7102]|uniref:CDP-alcohol phosphatidyltransferase n=1 Tax=Dulcicalothrix desertica PCC 7102 TaxID=232991 RepID=A0A433V9G9_9CYAN|nr:CDP-alcohol phosphatidyltransferase family protein [Dulcicalothrix desertica]RUT02762.1 CDP-alcohol phosphatidyltransferase [Dulcicalothrix desertica PCC 7102]TWH39003.1 Phosphatidylglycerophosphate synthase [Dulcicalothrix desertica PCC 7102]
MTKTWDAQLANWLVRPLINTWITPNYLTTVRLITGLIASLILAIDIKLANLGAFIFALSSFLDHTDGELARISGKTSKWGYNYDFASDAVINVFVFVGIGIGLKNSQLGHFSILMGLISGIAIACIFYCIFHLRNKLEQQPDKDVTRQLNFAGFDIEDILYLFPVVTLLNQLHVLLVAATIGAPIFAIWVLWQYRKF